ncbi:MAG: hypothetical protein OIF50_01580 [Flavobacteriaceae bacterium]|nr:hypothetical protein [Flavobacteriaceae bacterium]
MSKQRPTLIMMLLVSIALNASAFGVIDSVHIRPNNTPSPNKLQNIVSTSTSEFTDAYLLDNFPLSQVTNERRLEAKAVMDELEVSQNYLDLVTPNDLVSLPVGVREDIGGTSYMLGISKARFTPEYTEVTAFVRIILPQMGSDGKQKEIFFGADNLKISHKGGIYGDANLVLLGDVPIKINGGNGLVILKGGFDFATGITEKLTYVTVDCSGFKELGLAADVQFPRSMLTPVDNAYKPIKDPNVKVSGSFQTIVGDWNDILAEITLPPFELHSLKGTVFQLNTAVFDFSDVRNSPNVIFHPEYRKYLIPGNEQAWRGVYVNTLEVVLPAQFEKRKSKERVRFQAANMLIDGKGVSGEFSVDNILPLKEGVASKWQFSVEHIEASFVANKLLGAGFDGQIVLPVSKEVNSNTKDSTAVRGALGYSAIINPSNQEYILSVRNQEAMSFDVFKAKATIAENSFIELKVKEDKFRPRAVLHGNLAIKGSNSKADPTKGTVDFKRITFQDLELQTEAPIFKVGYMGYNGDVKLANFPVSISNIEVHARDNQVGLGFDLAVNLMSQGFNGKTRLDIIGSMEDGSGLDRWKFDKLKVNNIFIQADLGAMKLKGEIALMDNDPTYGDGFYGKLEADFSSIKVTASALFGKKDFRYWYVDGLAELNPGPSIGVLEFNAFGGGAYYRMSRRTGGYSSKIPTGMDYVPDNDVGLGVRALVGFSTTSSEQLFNGKAGFEIAFNRHGGVNRIAFYGEGHLVQPIDFKFGDKFKDKLTKLEDKINSYGDNDLMNALKESNLVDYTKATFPKDGLSFEMGIDAYVAIEHDFKNKVLHGSFDVFVNTPGGFFQGVGPKGRAGWAVFHISPKEWYIHIGTPEDRIGLKLGIGSFYIKSTAYLMVGDKIPGSPPPPAIVSEILGVETESLDYMRDLNSLGEGRGFAFGAELSMDTGDMTFLIFYARFQAGLGFDIMLKDYGEAACKGRGQIGINGWYANGQSYAYLQGELGIKIKLMFIRKKIPIISAGAAVLLQAKLPNPAWFRGYLGGHYNLLGGLVKGRFRFKLELGEECELVQGGVLGGMKIIADLSPKDQSDNVDVFAVPQAAFNMRINKEFELEDDEGVKKYKILLEKFQLTKEGQEIAGEMEWNSNNDVLNFVTHDILPPNSNLKVYVRVSFQEYKGGSWQTIYDKGKKAIEEKEIAFTTGEAPDHIPKKNILYCYPVIAQKNFYPKESNSGYVKLHRGQPYLFTPETDWQQKIKFEGETTVSSDLQYNTSTRTVLFKIPDLAKQKEYRIYMFSMPPASSDDSSTQQTYTNQNLAGEDNTVAIRNKQLSGVKRNVQEQELLSYDFHTSNFDLFKDKIAAKQITRGLVELIFSDVQALQADVQKSEAFGIVELNGSTYTHQKPMIQIVAVLNDSYYQNKIYPLVYKDYPLEADLTVDRDLSQVNIPPNNAVDVLSWYAPFVENNNYSHPYLNPETRLAYRYNLPFYYKSDFIDIQYKIINKYLVNPDLYATQIAKYKHLITTSFPAIQKGDYQVKLQYMFPNGKKGSSNIFKFNNPY